MNKLFVGRSIRHIVAIFFILIFSLFTLGLADSTDIYLILRSSDLDGEDSVLFIKIQISVDDSTFSTPLYDSDWRICYPGSEVDYLIWLPHDSMTVWWRGRHMTTNFFLSPYSEPFHFYLRRLPPVIDTLSPVISNLFIAGITENGATIIWETDELSNSRVDYQRDKKLNWNFILDTSFVLSHQIVLTQLQSNKLYYFRITSKDRGGNIATQSRSFRTNKWGRVNVYPNPYTRELGVAFITFVGVPENSIIKIFNIRGQLVKTLKADDLDEVKWDVTGSFGQKISSGIYFYRVMGLEEIEIGKFIIIR